MSSENNYIYVTYLSNDRDYKGVLLLNYIFKKYKSNYRLSCIVLEGVSNKIKELFKKSDIILHEFILKDVLSEFNMNEDYCNYLINKHYYGKFLIFKLLQYEKIIYIDTDLLIKENIDYLFSYDTENKIYMTYDVGYNFNNNSNNLVFRTQLFNSGVIILQPSIDIYNKCYSCLSEFENNIQEHYTDQTVLNLLNKNNEINVVHLNYKYNYVAMLGDSRNIINDEPIVIHFILYPKPWQIVDFDENLINLKIYSNTKIYFYEWIDLYFEMVKELLNEITKFDTYLIFDKIYLDDGINYNQIQKLP